MTDIHEIVDPSIQINFFLLLGLGLLGLLLAYIIFQFLYKRTQSNSKLHAVQQAQPTIDLNQLRNALLTELEQMKTGLENSQDPEYTTYYYRLSTLLREFISAYFRFPAESMTKTEVVVRIEQDYQFLINEIMGHCYKIEFTPYPGSKEETISTIQKTANFIRSC